ncbi:hypothetical protein LguiB_000971 [Lonicera macranthoides]
MDIPEGVKIKVKAKMIEVEGPRGPRDNSPHLSKSQIKETIFLGGSLKAHA